jgi:hypothetical protein
MFRLRFLTPPSLLALSWKPPNSRLFFYITFPDPTETPPLQKLQF